LVDATVDLVIIFEIDAVSVLSEQDRMGSRVERVVFAWERGKVREP
jgi:hypothetical protein